MRRERILHPDINSSSPFDHMRHATAIHQRDSEVADLGDAASDGGTIRGLNGCADGKRIVRRARRPHPATLQLVGRAVLARYMGEGGGAMAGSAVGCKIR